MIPSIGVVIATYTRAALLDECLRHLRAQPFRNGDEVIVVDNGSVDHTAEVVRGYQAGFPAPLHLLHEGRPGKSHALSRALAVARTAVLAFLDDDITVGQGWLDAIRSTMIDPSVALMGGRVTARWEASVPMWMRQAPDQHPRLGAPLGLLEYAANVVELGPRTVLGANMAVRRDVFDSVGGFATHLGKLRGTLLSGEDHEFCLRVQRAGFKAIYAPDAIVHHWVPADRARVGYFLHWFYWSGITNAILDTDSAAAAAPPTGRSADRKVPAYLVKRSARALVGVLSALVAGRRTAALNHAIDIAFAAGYIAQRLGLSSRQRATTTQATPEAA
jgi:glucosyl-dolichyl phosphate glucuronosyltransferase